MKRPLVVTTLVALVAGGLGVQGAPSARAAAMPGCSVSGPVKPAAERSLVRLINVERRRRGATPLRRLTRLVVAARANNRRMASRRKFSHPAGGLTFGRGRRAAQNLAFMPNASSAFAGFMGSPPHRANMLGRRWRTIGVGAMRCRGMLIFTVNITA